MTGRGPFCGLTIFHYHLLPGGVTDVIVLSVRAVLRLMPEVEKVTVVFGRTDNADRVEKKIVAGLEPELRGKLSLVCYPLVDYLERVDNPPSAADLAADLEARFPGADNLWMVHNYQLGKNPLFTQALLLAAERGDRPLLFQIHDFPECSRYANLAALKEGTDRQNYPQRKNTAYCVINARDRNYLTQAGLEEENVWLLNNPVPLGETARTDAEAVKSALYKRYSSRFPALREKGKLVFYPVRSIRRKNIFEAAFLLKLAEGETNFMVSLPGVSPAEKPYSDLAERAFTEGLIPGLWGVGAEEETELLNYGNFWGAADLVISPSIQEGFGYLYLNALHWGKPLFARYLDIMEGFKFLFPSSSSHFYDRVPLPLTEREKGSLRELYSRKMDALAAYMPPGRRESLDREREELLREDRFCFSYLTPAQQYDCLERLDRDSSFREEAARMNRENLEALERITGASVPDRDGPIGESFGEEKYVETLRKIMASLEGGCVEVKEERDIQGTLEERFFSLAYLRLLYGAG
ncbi:MAG: hypothetical protein PQJ60_14605, partial [Spirochaetales bacterium]|nr:hypothetical protein [Spirochaetales bacterium]